RCRLAPTLAVDLQRDHPLRARIPVHAYQRARPERLRHRHHRSPAPPDAPALTQKAHASLRIEFPVMIGSSFFRTRATTFAPVPRRIFPGRPGEEPFGGKGIP